MNHRVNRSRLPLQKLPLNKKTEEWRETTLDSYIAREGGGFKGGLSRNERKKILYDLWNSKYDLNDIKYVVDPFKVGEGFPAKPQNFNIIRPKIELLIGEETKRPFNMRVVQTGDDGYNQTQEVYKEMLFNYVMAQMDNQEQEEGQPETPQAIQDYVNHRYSDITEKKALYSLKYLNEKLNIPNEFIKGWRDALICGEEMYFIGIVNGEPHIERVNPLTVTYDMDPDLEYIEDGEFVIRHMYMSPTSIYDRFQDIMTEADLDKILDEASQEPATGSGSDVNYQSIIYKDNPLSNDQSGGGSSNELDVWHVVWKSYKKIGFLTTIDENGEEVEETVDETYDFTAEDEAAGSTITWEWAIEVWEGYRVGKDIYFGIDPIPNQMVSIDNPNSMKLPYTGAIYNNANTDGVSLVELMKPLQYMYMIVWYRLEVALARDKGKIINMDITQIPKSMNVDVSKWLHMLTSLGVNLFNPYEEGWDIPGREGGKPASYNQMSGQDLTMTNTISQYIELMNKIEEMVGELSGVSRQRQGSINTHELVGNVERSVIQSSHITEPYFWVHNQVKKNVLNLMLNTAKIAWSERPNSVKLNYILDDMTRICMEMSDDFLYSDHAIFVSDSSEENRKIEQLRSLYEAALQSGAPLSDIASIVTYDTVTEIKNKLKDIETERMKAAQEQEQAQMEAAQQAQEFELSIRDEENRIKEEDSIRKANTAVEVALIQANSKLDVATNSQDIEDNTAEIEKLAIEREKMNKESELKRKEFEETVRSNKKQEELKDKEISVKKIQANKTPRTNNK